MKTALMGSVVALAIALLAAAPASAATVIFTEDFNGYAPGPVGPGGVGGPGNGLPWTENGAMHAYIVTNGAIDGAGSGDIPFSQTDGNTGTQLGTGVNRIPGSEGGPHDSSDTTQYLAIAGVTGSATSGGIQSSPITAAVGYTNLSLSFDYAAYRTELNSNPPDKLNVWSATNTSVCTVANASCVLLATLDLGGSGQNSGKFWTTYVTSFVKDAAASILLEFNTAVSEWEVGYLDNIVLTAVPLPAALPLGAAGLGVMGFLSWRKRKREATAALA